MESFIDFCSRIYSPSFTGDAVAEIDARSSQRRAIISAMANEIGGDTIEDRRERAYQAWFNADAAGDIDEARRINIYRSSLH